MNELISIIVPIYKVEKYICQCVKSIINQTVSKSEIILIDDGSPDVCPEMCDELSMTESRIVVVHKQNGGLSDARNTGLESCRGDYIAFIDSDDWIESDYVEKMLGASKEYDADIVACGFVNENEKNGKTELPKKEFFCGNTEQALRLLYDQTRIAAAAMKFYKARIWKELRFPVGKLYEDTLTTYKVFDTADRIVQIPDGLYHYRIRENSIMRSTFSLKNVGISDAWKENYQFCSENYPKVAEVARMFWLEHIPAIISEFPKEMSEEEKKAKSSLKREILDNLGFVIRKMPLKKKYYQIIALLFL